MRYQFVDKIRRLEWNHSITTVKNVTVAEDYFQEHFVGFPVFPGALQIETMAQACGALIEISSEYRLFSILLMVEKMKFKRLIHPGDQLLVQATVVSRHDDSALFDVRMECEGHTMSTGRLMTGIVTAESMNAEYQKVIATLEEHFRFLLRDTEIIR